MSVVGALQRNWWMMAVRGGLAVMFGLIILLWPNVTLPVVVTLFGCYAVIDGAWTVATARRASTRLFAAWPVLLEGVVSVGLGLLALMWPFMPAEGVRVLAQWGIATGVLEVLAAAHVPRSAGHSLLLTGGISSLFLAFVLLILPHADVDSVVHLLVAYAEVFGFAVLLAAFWFGQRGSNRVGYARTAH